MEDKELKIRRNLDVYDSKDQKVGTVADLYDSKRYFSVHTGFMGMGTTYYIPYDAVSTVDDVIHLNLSFETIRDRGWSSPPKERTEAYEEHPRRTMEYEGTEERVPLREEELEVRRRSEKAGEVKVSKDIEEERQRMNIPTTKEEVTIERRPVEGKVEKGPVTGEGEVRIPIREEEVEVTKHPVTREEVVIHKGEVTEEHPVEETIKREVPRVEKKGDVDTDVDKDLTDEERRRRRKAS
ncbi:MAG: YsnF/AvaK domain-containing protein [Chloroflexota bacterium]